jgi:hypothetical protein
MPINILYVDALFSRINDSVLLKKIHIDISIAVYIQFPLLQGTSLVFNTAATN